MRRLFGRQWLLVHLGVVFVVAVFLGLARWQLLRADQGNARSVGYALEWPSFALIVIVMWVRSMRDEVRKARGRPPTPAPPRPGRTPSRLRDTPPIAGQRAAAIIAAAERDDAELAAYNTFLRRLHAHDTPAPR